MKVSGKHQSGSPHASAIVCHLPFSGGPAPRRARERESRRTTIVACGIQTRPSIRASAHAARAACAESDKHSHALNEGKADM